MHTNYETIVPPIFVNDDSIDVNWNVNSNDVQGDDDSAYLSLRIPLLADLDSLPSRYKKNNQRNVDSYAIILDSFVSRCEDRHKTYDTAFSFHRDYFKKPFGGDYKFFLNQLIKANYIEQVPYEVYQYKNEEGDILETKGKWKRGSGTRYRLKPHSFGADPREESPKKILLREYQVKDAHLIDKIDKLRAESTTKLCLRNLSARNVFENTKRLSIDYESALEYIAHKYCINQVNDALYDLKLKTGEDFASVITKIQSSKSSKIINSILAKYGIQEAVNGQQKKLLKYKSQYETRRHAINTILEISKGNHSLISISEDNKTGRLFHTLTMTPKDLKPFMRLGGQPLCELDASNSQWYMLKDLLREIVPQIDIKGNVLENRSNKLPYIKKYDKAISTNINNQPTPPITLWHSFSNTGYVARLNKEIEALELMLNTTTESKESLFREHFTNKYNEVMARDGKVALSSGEVKMRLIKQVLFDNPNASYYTKHKAPVFFRETFPEIMRLINLLKTDYIDETQFGYSASNRWKCLSLILQKREADIFVSGMEKTNSLYLIIHDAIVTNEDNIPLVYKSLTEAVKMAESSIKIKKVNY